MHELNSCRGGCLLAKAFGVSPAIACHAVDRRGDRRRVASEVDRLIETTKILSVVVLLAAIL